MQRFENVRIKPNFTINSEICTAVSAKLEKIWIHLGSASKTHLLAKREFQTNSVGVNFIWFSNSLDRCAEIFGEGFQTSSNDVSRSVDESGVAWIVRISREAQWRTGENRCAAAGAYAARHVSLFISDRQLSAGAITCYWSRNDTPLGRATRSCYDRAAIFPSTVSRGSVCRTQRNKREIMIMPLCFPKSRSFRDARQLEIDDTSTRGDADMEIFMRRGTCRFVPIIWG